MGITVERFEARAAHIPVHGIGLSVDVFSPDVLDLYQALDVATVPPAYLELFKAPTRELARVRAALPDVPLTYHAEGLWLMDPAMREETPWREAVETVARHAEAIGAGWVNHECAGKQIGGYSFGTYLPPIFTHAAAQAVAENVIVAQETVDEWYVQAGHPDATPLFLLELPPLTYFGIGDLPVSEFFARIVERVSCGLVLDIGHLWTHWRYREHRRGRSLEAFTEAFCATFPLDRVIQIHLAGLGLHDTDQCDTSHHTIGETNRFPRWIDKHEAPVRDVLFDLLRHILGQPGLTALKGIALEVDGKAIPTITEEFGRLRGTVTRNVFGHAQEKKERMHGATGRGAHEGTLTDLYEAYARVVSGQEALETSLPAPLAQGLNPEGLHRYITSYLPHELLCWGGDLAELFPTIWASLEARGVAPMDFVRCWFRQSRPVIAQYDFFSLKLERWVEFVGEVAPDLLEQAQYEAVRLRDVHADLNDEAVTVERLG